MPESMAARRIPSPFGYNFANRSLRVKGTRMIILITGATSGFGVEIARKFVQTAHKVIATGRRKEPLEGLAAEPGAALRPITMATLPPHVNINYIEMMPTCQGFSPFSIKWNI